MDKKEFVTIGAIAKKLEGEAFDEGDGEKSPFSARTVERRFRKLLEYIDVDFEIVKDEQENYSFEKEGEVFIEVLLLESVTPNSFFNNVITNKEHLITTQDVIDTFERARDRVQSKVIMTNDNGIEQEVYRYNPKIHYETLMLLDRILNYSIVKGIKDIDDKLIEFQEDIKDFSYGEKVCLIHWLSQNISNLTQVNKLDILGGYLKSNEPLAEKIKKEGDSKYFRDYKE